MNIEGLITWLGDVIWALKMNFSLFNFVSTFVSNNFHLQTPNTYKVTPFSIIANFIMFQYSLKILSHNFIKIKTQKRAKTFSTQPIPTAIPTEIPYRLLFKSIRDINLYWSLPGCGTSVNAERAFSTTTMMTRPLFPPQTPQRQR